VDPPGFDSPPVAEEDEEDEDEDDEESDEVSDDVDLL
jgi:hypothetical protein